MPEPIKFRLTPPTPDTTHVAVGVGKYDAALTTFEVKDGVIEAPEPYLQSLLATGCRIIASKADEPKSQDKAQDKDKDKDDKHDKSEQDKPEQKPDLVEAYERQVKEEASAGKQKTADSHEATEDPAKAQKLTPNKPRAPEPPSPNNELGASEDKSSLPESQSATKPDANKGMQDKDTKISLTPREPNKS